MRCLIISFFLLFTLTLSCQIRPDFVPIEENPDTSNFEVYGQKNGNLRRSPLDAVGSFVLENYSIQYDSSENRLRIVSFGTSVDTLNLTGTAGAPLLFSNDTLSANGTNVFLGDYNGVLSYDSSTYSLTITQGGKSSSVSLSNLIASVSFNSSNGFLTVGPDSVDLSYFTQAISYDTSTNVLSLSNGGGSVIISGGSGSGLSSVTTESYFGGDGTAINPLSIDNSGLNFSKIQNVASNTVAGRYSSGVGQLEQITLGSDFEVSSAGVLSVSNNSAIDNFREVLDTSFTSSGGDLPSSIMDALLSNYEEVRLDITIESGASSNFIINLPNAFAKSVYKNRTISIYVTDLSSSYDVQLNNVENVSGEIYFFEDKGSVNIKAISESGTPQWILVGENNSNLNSNDFFEVDSLNLIGVKDKISVSTNYSGDPVLVTLTVDSPESISSANIIVNTTKDFTIRVTDSSGKTNNDVSDLWLPTINVYDISSVDLSGTTGDNVSHNNTDYIPSSIEWSPSNAVDIQFSGGDYSSKSKLLIIMTW